MSSYYEILGVDKTYSMKKIKEAYHRLAKKYHPDNNDGCKVSEEAFKSINEAYDWLKRNHKQQKEKSKQKTTSQKKTSQKTTSQEKTSQKSGKSSKSDENVKKSKKKEIPSPHGYFYLLLFASIALALLQFSYIIHYKEIASVRSHTDHYKIKAEQLTNQLKDTGRLLFNSRKSLSESRNEIKTLREKLDAKTKIKWTGRSGIAHSGSGSVFVYKNISSYKSFWKGVEGTQYCSSDLPASDNKKCEKYLSCLIDDGSAVGKTKPTDPKQLSGNQWSILVLNGPSNGCRGVIPHEYYFDK